LGIAIVNHYFWSNDLFYSWEEIPPLKFQKRENHELRASTMAIVQDEISGTTRPQKTIRHAIESL